MSDFYKPEHAAAVKALVETLDPAELARKSNALTDSSLRPEDAVTLLTQVALTAMRSPGTEVIVAGLGASFSGTVLKVWYGHEIATREIQAKETNLIS